MGGLTLITGGARSGKSSFALGEALKAGGRRLFIATLEPLDAEMGKRVALHRAERGDGWDTREEPLELASLIGEIAGRYQAAVVDCLTLWLSNVMHSGKDVNKAIDELSASVEGAKRTMHLYVVSNEVGMGIVPENEVARAFRDYAGLLNQRIAAVADEVFLMASGIPVKIK